MLRRLQTQLSLTISLVVVLSIALISVLANVLIRDAFEKNAVAQRDVRSQDIVTNLSSQYDSAADQWDPSFVHGVGMFALYDGYVIRLIDQGGNIVWDAENHDMALCNQIMEEISDRMDRAIPLRDAGFSTLEFDLVSDGQYVGKVEITSYGPFFFTENDVRFLEAINVILVVIALLSLGFSILAGSLLSRQIARPMTDTVHLATQISDGNYGIQSDTRTDTIELHELVTAVNHMSDSLRRQEDLRKQLTTDVAHELRTPLTSVSSYLEAMIEGVWEPTPERLRSCHEEISRIASLVAELEKLAQVENDNGKRSVEPFDLYHVAGVAADTFTAEAMKRGITIQVDGTSCVIPGDKDRIQQVITNLLSNAIKFSRDGGRIRVTVEDRELQGTLTVRDDGIGIPEDEIPLVFERFYRTDKSRNRKTGGAGIGLTIAKSIVTAHGGTIDVRSKLNQGSTFTVTLPKIVE